MPTERLPTSGPLPQPTTVQQAAEQLKEEAISTNKPPTTITFNATEFTSLCPRTGQPDFNTIQITYNPTNHIIESKALKYYLWAYRNHGAFCETLSRQIAEDINHAVQPATITVTVNQSPRGGIAIHATTTITNEHQESISKP